MDLEVLTLNCWGLWLVAKQRARRLRLIAEALKQTTADVVHLQEVWCRSDADLILEEAAKGKLRHGHHFVAGHFGSGLLTLSRFPLKQVRFVQFTAAGDPVSLKGDYFAGKGVGWAQLETPAGIVDTFNTHLSANYKQSWRDAPELGCRIGQDGNAGVRILQMQQLATFVQGASHPEGVAVIVAGDLNNPPDSLHMHFMQSLLPDLQDAWVAANPKNDGPTANHPESSFSTIGAGKSPTRIDYVWTSSDCQVLSAQVSMKSAQPGLSFSDHFGVSVQLRLAEPGNRRESHLSRQPFPPTSKAANFQAAALDSMQTGIAAMARGSQNAAICASALAVICIVLWAILLAFSYWSYSRALHTAFTAILLPCCLLLPFVFFFGYGARSGEAQALHEVATEANIRIQALNRDRKDHLGTGSLGSEHQQGRPAGSSTIPSHAPHVQANPGSGTGQGPERHSRDDGTSQAAGPSTSSPSVTRFGAHSSSAAKPGPLHGLNHPAGDQASASSAATPQAAHAEDQEGTWAGLSGQPHEQHGRQATSIAAQSHGPMDPNRSAAEHTTSGAPLLIGHHNNSIRPSSNSWQETAPLMGTNHALANGDGYQEQAGFTDAGEETMIQQKQQPVLSNDELPARIGVEQASGSHFSSGMHGDEANGTHNGRPVFGLEDENPQQPGAANRLRTDADNEVRQLGQNRFDQPTTFPAAHHMPPASNTSPPQADAEATVPEDSRESKMQMDIPARPRSPFDRLRLEALTEGPSDGAPEPFPNADTFRGNHEDGNPLQADANDHLTLTRRQPDSFSFPELLDGAPIRRRSPAVSLEPTRAAAGAFGSSVLNYDHQLQQRPRPLTGPSPAVLPETAPTPSLPGNAHSHARDNGNFITAEGTQDTHGNDSGSGFTLTSDRASKAGMDSQAQPGFSYTAGGASGPSSAVSMAPSSAAAHLGISPEHEAEDLLGSSPLPIKPYGRLRSGRLGEEVDGGEGTAASSPNHSQSTGSPMKATFSDQDTGPMHRVVTPGRSPSSPIHSQTTGTPMKATVSDEDAGPMHRVVTPGRSPSPLGVVRAGRLGE